MKTIILGALIVGALGCGSSGMGDAVRKDISDTMGGAQGDLSSCYKASLERRRKNQGRLLVAFDALAKTGKFSNVRVTQDEVGDPELVSCVVEKLAGLALSKPQSTNVSVDAYPIDFRPDSE